MIVSGAKEKFTGQLEVLEKVLTKTQSGPLVPIYIILIFVVTRITKRFYSFIYFFFTNYIPDTNRVSQL